MSREYLVYAMGASVNSLYLKQGIINKGSHKLPF